MSSGEPLHFSSKKTPHLTVNTHLAVLLLRHQRPSSHWLICTDIVMWGYCTSTTVVNFVLVGCTLKNILSLLLAAVAAVDGSPWRHYCHFCCMLVFGAVFLNVFIFLRSDRHAFQCRQEEKFHHIWSKSPLSSLSIELFHPPTPPPLFFFPI